MFCTKCGAAVPAGAAFCTSCGQPMTASTPSVPPPVTPPIVPAPLVYAAPVPPPVYAAVAPGPPYAGFWLRFVAALIDGAIVNAVVGVFAAILLLAFGGLAFVESIGDRLNDNDAAVLIPIFMALGLFVIFIVVGQWLYFALMESSMRQGTLGKMAMGLAVTDMNGQRVTFGRASGRFFSKMISGMIPLGIGYIMAGFTEKKQALHDMIASCLVFKKV